MIKSRFILDILDLLLDGDEEGLIIRQQVEWLTDANYNYTGSGLFVGFSHDMNALEKRIEADNLILNGVQIISTELKNGADATLFLSNGIIDYLEIWSQDGRYPYKELSDYILNQVWINSPKRQLTKNK